MESREELGEDREDDEEENIERKEFEKVMRKLKKEKAAGSDKLENEIWKWEGVEVKEKLWEMCKKTAYKVYASVLVKRLRKDIEEKGILPRSQAGFRRDMGTVDQIYVLNYLINKKIEKERKCPSLFTLLLADFDKELEKGGWRGIRLKDKRFYSLAYADDIALMAENEAGIKGMIKNMDEYVKKKGLEMNVKKTKIMRCRKGGGRWKKVKWVWKEEEIEEVKSFKYLRYMIMRNGEQREHVKDRVKRAARIMGQVWSIGKRKFGKDWSKRI
ncbi:uncharacterized protein [Cardiocondyla obscurior]|uniref:uncharacterized protein n=1 Tax=Cardiocondyla obscurior TaxID=286306 RepID=UPI0039658786